MDMRQLLQGMQKEDTVDSSEQVYISSLSLLKMLRHGTRQWPLVFLRARD